VAWNPKTKCAIVRDIDELKQNASRLLRILHRQYAEDGKAALSPENHKYLSIRDLADALSLDETAVRKELSRTRKAVDLAFLQKFGVKAPAGALIEHSTIVHGYRINPHVRFVDYQQLVSGS
jgi:predicted transcriptional regulator of viral defense system